MRYSISKCFFLIDGFTGGCTHTFLHGLPLQGMDNDIFIPVHAHHRDPDMPAKDKPDPYFADSISFKMQYNNSSNTVLTVSRFVATQGKSLVS